MSTPGYPFHEAASIFPLMTGPEYADLKADIDKNGQREPVWLWEGKVIDGRNRVRACRDLGRPVLAREWDGQGSLVDFVLSLNLHRRHMDAWQRAVAAAKAKQLY